MALKTTYKDDVFTGNRKYTFITNQDGTVSLVDATEYSEEGDTFSATDVNQQNTEINKNTNRLKETQFTLASANWSSTPTTVNGRSVYTYVVNCTAISSDNPIWDVGSSGVIPSEAEEENGSYLVAMTVNKSTNKMTFYAQERPSVDLVINVKGVN